LFDGALEVAGGQLHFDGEVRGPGFVVAEEGFDAVGEAAFAVLEGQEEHGAFLAECDGVEGGAAGADREGGGQCPPGLAEFRGAADDTQPFGEDAGDELHQGDEGAGL
jgi:hypothetical protein